MRSGAQIDDRVRDLIAHRSLAGQRHEVESSCHRPRCGRRNRCRPHPYRCEPADPLQEISERHFPRRPRFTSTGGSGEQRHRRYPCSNTLQMSASGRCWRPIASSGVEGAETIEVLPAATLAEECSALELFDQPICETRRCECFRVENFGAEAEDDLRIHADEDVRLL